MEQQTKGIEQTTAVEGSQRNIVVKLTVVAICMFGFGFLLIPIYNVLCDITGLNGKTSQQAYSARDMIIDKTREVEIQFVASNNDGMIWEFRPNLRKIVVHPGEPTDVSFFAANPSNKLMVAQAIPSVAPSKAAQYFHKTQCFCFDQQALEAKDSVDMPLRFIVDPDLPKDVKTITLSYVLFDVSDKFGNQDQKKVEQTIKRTKDKFKG